MSMIEWNDSLSVHVMEIDNQHKGLIDLINDIYELIRSGIDDKMQVISILSDLRAYTVVHFGTEERYMESYDYPDIQLHKNEHKYFVDKVCDVEDKCIDGSCIMSMDLLNFLSSWLVTHISRTDNRMGEFFKANNIPEIF